MFGLGLLSLLQVWFLPGLSLLVFAKKLKLIDRFLLSLPLSITINYIIIFSLVLLNSYNQTTISILIFIEILLIIIFFKKDKNGIKDLKKLINFVELKKIQFKLNIIDIFIFFLFLIYLFLAISNIGNVVGKGDPVTYYLWTLDIINNKIPSNTYDYPQGASILSSISFVLLGTLKIEFFSAAIFLIQPLWIFFVFLRSIFLLKEFENEIKYSLIFTSIIVLYNFRHYLLFINLPDATIVLGTVIGAYILILFYKKIEAGINIETILFCFVIAFPALLKQVGIYSCIIFPIIYLVLFYNKDKLVINNFILISSIIFLIISPWYIIKFYEYFILGYSKSSVLGIASSLNTYENFLEYFVKVLYRLFGFGLFPILILIFFSLKHKLAKNIFLLFLFPYFAIYLLVFGYEFRAFAPAMAVVGILCGIGLSQILKTIKKYYDKKNIAIIYKSIIFLSAILSLLFLNEIRNFEKLKNLNLQAIKKRGDHELNVLLYNFLNKNDKYKDVYVIRDYNNLKLLPEFTHKFFDTECNDFKSIYENNPFKSYYILVDLREINSKKNRNICKKNFLDILNSVNEQKYVSKIFEYKRYIMYLREYK